MDAFQYALDILSGGYGELVHFGGYGDPLSNFFEWDMVFDGRTLPTVEHHYQTQRCLFNMDIVNPEDLGRVMFAPSPKEAMIQARRLVPAHLLSAGWMEQRVMVMDALMNAKYVQCPPFRHALASHGRFIEDTNNHFWARGRHNDGQNMFGLCLQRARHQHVAHYVIIGDSHLRDMDFSVQCSTPLPGCRSSAVQYGSVCLGNSSALVTVMYNPGISTAGLFKRIDKYPSVVGTASHVVTVVGTNDFPSDPSLIQKKTKQLHSLIQSINPKALVFYMCVFPRRDEYDDLVLQLNKFKIETSSLCIQHKLRRNSLPIVPFYDVNDPTKNHLSTDGKLKVWSTIIGILSGY